MRFAIGDDPCLSLHAVLAEFWGDAIRLPLRDLTVHDRSSLPDSVQSGDFDAVVRGCGDFRPDWVIVDHYGLDAVWHHCARSFWGCSVAVIDDLANRDLAPDILIDHNWDRDHRAKYRDRIPAKVLLLAGPRFALIDEKFAAVPIRNDSAVVRSVGVFMGGTDPGGSSGPALDVLRETGFHGWVEIVSTSVNPRLDSLRQIVAQDGTCTLSHDLPDLFTFFRRHDLFVLAAGGVTWERMASAVPAIAVVTADNQRLIAEQLEAEGYQRTVAAGDWARLSTAVSRLLSDATERRTIADRGRTLVDGRGAARVALAVLTWRASTVTVRLATTTDAERVFGWRNDPAIRAVSRNTAPLDLENHRRWFAAATASPDRLVLIAEIKGLPVGMVRFDRLSDAMVEISILIDPMLAGLRLGDGVIAAAQAALASRRDSSVEILAETLPDNCASQQLFLRAGYRRDGNHFRLVLPSAPGLLAKGNDANGVGLR